MLLTVQTRRLLASVALLFTVSVSSAQTPATGLDVVAIQKSSAQRSTSDWLLRMHEASRRKAYIGTLVVSSGGSMASSRIWHVCDGAQQMERIESLSGPPRATFRHNTEVITFSPQTKVARMETRESLGLFPGLLKSPDTNIDEFYTARLVGAERVAGFDADVIEIEPKDKLRFAYQVWSEKKSGLVVRLQTLDLQKRVLEQVAFSELQMDAPVNMGKLTQMMAKTEDYRVERQEIIKTSAEAEGWRLTFSVPGFKSMSCYRRPGQGEQAAEVGAAVQWVFSDGLATVSLFVESFAPGRHGSEGFKVMGATHTLSRRVPDKAGAWWLTAVGEVPVQTLQAFADALERRK
jgi:sigma-E factor negative regulatory protein RseB